MNNSQVVKNKRPVWVWIFSIFFFISAVYTLLSLYLLHSGFVPITEENRLYIHFKGWNTLDYLFSYLLVLLYGSGSVTLFLLRKIAFPLFLSSFIANTLLTIDHILTQNLLTALGSSVAISMYFISWIPIMAVCFYSRRLSKAGVLK